MLAKYMNIILIPQLIKVDDVDHALPIDILLALKGGHFQPVQ